MQLLKMKGNNVYIKIKEDKEVSIKDLNRDDLFEIMMNIYNDESYYDNLEDELADTIPNEIHRAMFQQIQQQLFDFQKNASSIKKEIENQFPAVDK